jgi:hypothetical protein
MQVELDDIGGGKPLLRQISEKEFVHNTRTRDTNRTLLVASLMRGHHHAAEDAIGSHWDLWAIVEAAHHLANFPLLKLIGRQVQTRLHERMIECGVLFASGHEREACHIGEHSPSAILSVESEQGTCLWELMRHEIARDQSFALTQFLPVTPIAAVAKRTEPLVTVGLTDDRARPYNLSALASDVSRGTDLIQPAKGRGQVFALGQGALAGRLPRPIDVNNDPHLPNSIR